jgi:hypothetical protein
MIEKPWAVPALAVDPRKPQTVYAAVTALGGTGAGFRSIDGAQRWRLASPFTLP